MLSFGEMVVFLACFAAMGTAETACEKNPQKKVALRDKVFCNYDFMERPVVDHKIPTNVSLQILLKNVLYNEHAASLALNFWATMAWMDGILNWKPEDNDNIKSLIVRADYLWNPDLSVYNRAEQTGSASLLETAEHCVLKHTGQVSCVSPNNHAILCQPDLKYFPFDAQYCAMIIGSWIHEGEEVNISTAKVPVSLSDFKDAGEWKLISATSSIVSGKYDCCPNTTFPYLQYTFHIERHSGVYVYMAIVPTITMFVMTFVSFFMEITGSERMLVVITNIILHVMYAQFYMWTLPISGPDAPLLLAFTRDSLIMTTILLVLNTIMRKLSRCRMESPKFIATATGFAMNSRAVQLIFMFDGSLKQVAERLGDDDGHNIIENAQTASATNDWLVLANLIDRVALILYFTVYCILCFAFIP